MSAVPLPTFDRQPLLASYVTSSQPLRMPTVCPRRHRTWPDLGPNPPAHMRRVFCDGSGCVFCGPRKASAVAYALWRSPVTHEGLVTLGDARAVDAVGDAYRLRGAVRELARLADQRAYFVVEMGPKSGALHAHVAFAGAFDRAKLLDAAARVGVVSQFNPRRIRSTKAYSKYLLKGVTSLRDRSDLTVEQAEETLHQHLVLNGRRLVCIRTPPGELRWIYRGVALRRQTEAVAAAREEWRAGKWGARIAPDLPSKRLPALSKGDPLHRPPEALKMRNPHQLLRNFRK